MDLSMKAVAATPQPTLTPAPEQLHSEMEQRRSEALSHIDYHATELSRWRAVAQATSAALESLNSPQQDTGEGRGF